MNANLLWLLTFVLIVVLAVSLEIAFFKAASFFHAIRLVTSRLPVVDRNFAFDSWSHVLSLPIVGGLALVLPHSGNTAVMTWASLSLIYDLNILRFKTPESSEGWRLVGIGALLRAAAWAIAVFISSIIAAAVS